jgi:hypothetical protein
MDSIMTEAQSIGAFGPSRSTVEGNPIEPLAGPIGAQLCFCRSG